MKQVFLIITMLVLLSCDKEEKHLDIYYMPELTLTAMNMDCRWIKPSMYYVKNTIIRDEDYIEKFDTHYSGLNESEKVYSPDVRIKIYYHHGKDVDTICMGEYFGTMVNGQQKEDSAELLKLIKDTIYSKFSRDNEQKKYYKQKRKLKTGKD